MKKKSYDIYIGIDPGTKTGVATWSAIEQRFWTLHTMPIHRALENILYQAQYHEQKHLVRIEDARQVRYRTKIERMQGAGSVKRDVAIWVAFLEDHGIDYELVRPAKRLTKWPAPVFAKVTGWKHPCSQHARDAAMLVFEMGKARKARATIVH